MKPMSAREFVDALSHSPKKSEDLFAVCMAKVSPDNPESIMLGPSHKCGPWTKIPLSVIGQIVPLSVCSCREHTHPIVAVYFKEKDDPTAAAVGQALRNMQKEAVSHLVTTSTGIGVSARMAGGFGDQDGPVSGPVSGIWCATILQIFCWPHPYWEDYPHPAANPGTWDCATVPVTVCVLT